MYLLLALISLAIGVSSSNGNIGDIPFSELTLNMIFGNLFAGACYLGTVYFGFKSFESDRIWPWRWTLPYVGNLLFRTGLSALLVYGASYLIEEKHVEGWWLITIYIGVGISLLVFFFSSEYEVFKEKLDQGNSNEP